MNLFWDCSFVIYLRVQQHISIISMRQSRARIVDILLKFSSIVFVKYHVCFLFADHFDQIELMFIQWRGAGPGASWSCRLQMELGGGRITDIDGVYKWVYGIERPCLHLTETLAVKTNFINSLCCLVDSASLDLIPLWPLCHSFCVNYYRIASNKKCTFALLTYKCVLSWLSVTMVTVI